MSHNLNSLQRGSYKGLHRGVLKGVIKGDTRSLDYGPNDSETVLTMTEALLVAPTYPWDPAGPQAWKNPACEL